MSNFNLNTHYNIYQYLNLSLKNQIVSEKNNIFKASDVIAQLDVANMTADQKLLKNYEIPEIVEDTFDYSNQAGISVGKIFGLRKPKYNSDVTGNVQDFGVIALDTAQ